MGRHLDAIVRLALRTPRTIGCGSGSDSGTLFGRSPERMDSPVGHRECKLKTQAGQVTLKMWKQPRPPLETMIME